MKDLGRWAQEQYRVAGERESGQARGEENAAKVRRGEDNKSRKS